MTSESNSTHCFSLPESADILEAEAILQQCSEAVEADKTVVIDASKVEKLTTPVVQLLLALEKNLNANSHALLLDKPSDAVVDVFDTLGLGDKIESWKEVAS